ncbi:MAG: single-stranded DNA-binding protein [Sorangium cellulosum]|nr:MAG: single-stranded DNA-binding protein [Sorangium cellulosum]
MSEGLNRVILLGNLGADPELKVTQGGTSVLKLRLATTERYMDRSGTRQERTEWHSIVIWGKRGEALHRYLAKGSRILVEGSLRTSSYEDRDGNKRYRTEIVATNVVFAGGGGGRSYAPRDEAPPPPRASAPMSDAPGAPEDPGDDFPNDDDIPF